MLKFMLILILMLILMLVLVLFTFLKGTTRVLIPTQVYRLRIGYYLTGSRSEGQGQEF